jgi:uncharacterized heparinase superfamily protein
VAGEATGRHAIPGIDADGVIPEDLALLGRTAVHLRPSQFAHRARLQTQRAALHRWPKLGMRLLASAAATAAPGWPAGFTPADALMPQYWPSLAHVSTGRIPLLGKLRELGDPPDWQQADAPLLWRFHLHYWDWAWGLAAASDRDTARGIFARLWRSWQDSCAIGRGDAWLPYPAALRAWSWCGLYRDLVADSDMEPEFIRALFGHAAFLRHHLESDLGGNHLVKDLKALAGLGVFLGREQLLQRALRILRRQLAMQVLPDGGHYERAPAYHCQVLADLIDLSDLLRAAGRPPEPQLTQAVSLMRRWLGAVLGPDGAVPLLNDGYPVSDALVAALEPCPAPAEPLLLLPDTGLVRAVAGGWHLIADVGAPCPDELPGHAHADTLGCLVYVDGQPLLVDTGTSTYAAGDARSYERSTAAHNTAEVDGADSTEVWGAFRAGRRARVRDRVTRIDDHGCLIAEAAHNGYQWLPGRPLHRRRWSLSGAGLRVDDEVTGSKRHTVTIRWHLASGSAIRLRAGGAVVTTAAGDFPVDISASRPLQLGVESRNVATDFEATVVAPVLTCRTETVLPVRVTPLLAPQHGLP